MQDLDELEERKILQMRATILDEQDERRAAEAKRKADKLATQQKLIDAEAARQMATRREQQDFLDKQLAEDYAKEKAKIETMRAERQRINDERRRDYLATIAASESHAKTKYVRQTHKTEFPFDGVDAEAEAMRLRDTKRMWAQKELKEFQARQAREKKEREFSEREREKLEMQHRLDEEADTMRRVQDYAISVLQKAREKDEADNQWFDD
jgi:hypothetical protein